MDGHDGVARVVLAGKQHAGLELFHSLGERLHLTFEFAIHVLAFAGKLEQRFDVGSGCRNDLSSPSNRFFQAFALLHYLLAFFRLVPEIRIVDLLF